MTVYTYCLLTHQHSLSDAFARANNRSCNNNTKYKKHTSNNQLEKKIHPNNTSKPAFLSKVVERQKS